eukprot:m.3100 g.3100  ORF g.3100 m.3100 type:complete len:442 (+) comp9050_c0_seq2:79-1404(+)
MSMLSLLLFALCLDFSGASECHGKPSPSARPNANPIQTEPPRFARSVKNAKLYIVGEGDEEISVVHLWGSPYEMGVAHGTIMKDKASAFIDALWSYLEEQAEEAVNSSVSIFKPWFLKEIANLGLEAALDLEISATKPYTGSYFYEELKGLSVGSGVDVKKLERIHLIGELTKGHCSMFGAWGSAVEKTDSKLLQLRALDWNVDGPFKNFPQITVYHPISGSGNGHAFINVGWTGWIGSITGISSSQMAISEIGVSFPDSSFGSDSRFGVPFTYFLRDILQFETDLAGAMNRTSTVHRTCSLILGYGDGKVSEFRGVEYSASVAKFFTDTNLEPEADWHPRISNVVYWGMDWLCPGYSQVLSQQLQKFHGNISADVTVHEILPVVQTGDLHIAVYDLTNMVLYVSNAKGDGEEGPQFAYDRDFVRLDVASLFALKPPSLND